MIGKIDFLSESKLVVEKKAIDKWYCSGDFVISKKVIRSLNSEIFDYLSCNDVYVNIYDLEFAELILTDLGDSLLNFISPFDDYSFLCNFNGSLKHVSNGERDRLMAFAEIIDFESFRPILELIMNHSDQGGRPAYDPVLMIKIEFLRTYYGISDEKIARRIRSDDVLQCFLILS
jgi:hypothetical protein